LGSKASGRSESTSELDSSRLRRLLVVKKYTAVVERCAETGLYVGHVPGFPGAHSQGATLDELAANLREVVELLLEDGEFEPESEFVGTQQIAVP
jgi:predicted RNase H-like HicB family nuclease